MLIKKTMNIKEAEELISIIGEEIILLVYKLVGSERISFAMLIKVMHNKKLLKQLDSSGYQCLAAVAKEFKISKRTVYRTLNKLYKK
ncbi:MAG TPA: helix-turn-helix domain-containing protein [Bacteroidia bacterium]